MEHVVLVDREDREIGTMEKLEAHRRALLHRAVSVIVFDARGAMLLQRRAAGKYHCPGLWANACCTHPRPGESYADAAARRLPEEMGFTTPLRDAFDFIYRAELDRGLVEHELDHVFVGEFDGEPAPDPSEVGEFRWVDPGDLAAGIAERPGEFAPWFRIIFAKMRERKLL